MCAMGLEGVVSKRALCTAKGLRLFVIDPKGSSVLNKSRNGLGAIRNSLEDSLIGGSRRSLDRIFGGDDIEYSKVMRFFTIRICACRGAAHRL